MCFNTQQKPTTDLPGSHFGSTENLDLDLYTNRLNTVNNVMMVIVSHAVIADE